MENNSPLAYYLRLELHHPIMGKLGYPGGQLERGIDSKPILFVNYFL